MTLCVASQRVFLVVMTQSGNFWIHSRMHLKRDSSIIQFV